MKYLKYFQTETERSAYKDSSNFILPNVNYVVESDSVNFNPYVPPVPAGGIVYFADGKLKSIHYNDWDNSLGTPVGVITIPKGFAPDGKARMVALSGQTRTTWGVYGKNTSLTDYDQIPTTDNSGSTTTGSSGNGYLPSDKIIGTMSYVDPGTRYRYSGREMIPSPYLTVDGKNEPNPAYYAEISGYNNALSDFSGLENTKVLVELNSANYPAANTCWTYKDAANSGTQWYLPAIGELGYIMPRCNKIQAGLAAVSAVQLDSSFAYWSSSEITSYNARYVAMEAGYVNSIGKDYTYYARPWAIID